MTISRYGDSVECGNANGTFFMAVFDCNAVGVANFQLTEARVDLQDNANVQDAPQATVKGDLFYPDRHSHLQGQRRGAGAEV